MPDEIEKPEETKDETKPNEETKPDAAPDKSQVKRYSDVELNRLLAKERRDAKAKYDQLRAEFDAFKEDAEAKQKEADERAKERVEELRKDLPEETQELLDLLTPSDQLEWLSKHGTPKKVIPKTPDARKERPEPKMGTII